MPTGSPRPIWRNKWWILLEYLIEYLYTLPGNIARLEELHVRYAT